MTLQPHQPLPALIKTPSVRTKLGRKILVARRFDAIGRQTKRKNGFVKLQCQLAAEL